MNDLPEYFTAESLAALVEISRATLERHFRQDVGQVLKAKETIPGLGIRYKASACRKYIALVTAGRELRGGEPQKKGKAA